MERKSYKEVLTHEMRELDLAPRDLAEGADVSYEHVRKILRGEPVQSEECNYKICNFLKLDVNAMWELAQREKLIKKYGEATLYNLLAPVDPILKDFWPRLSRDQKERVRNIVRGMAEQNGTSRRFAAAS